MAEFVEELERLDTDKDDPRNRELTYKELLIVRGYPEDEIKDWDEDRCEDEYDCATHEWTETVQEEDVTL